MLLAWNYQNSNAVRNGTDGPDLNTMTGLWQQYQTALGLNNKTLTAAGNDQAVSVDFGFLFLIFIVIVFYLKNAFQRKDFTFEKILKVL
jgi:hypothetical protein